MDNVYQPLVNVQCCLQVCLHREKRTVGIERLSCHYCMLDAVRFCYVLSQVGWRLTLGRFNHHCMVGASLRCNVQRHKTTRELHHETGTLVMDQLTLQGWSYRNLLFIHLRPIMVGYNSIG